MGSLNMTLFNDPIFYILFTMSVRTRVKAP